MMEGDSSGEQSKTKKRKKTEHQGRSKKARKLKVTKKDKENVEVPTEECKDLDLDTPMYPIAYYMKERSVMIDQLFHCVAGASLRRSLPDILKDMPLAELKAHCLRQLEVMSKKRILRILEGDDPAEISSSGTDDDSDANQGEGGDKNKSKHDDEEADKDEASYAPSQMEILELEMRARAIKAMLKSHGGGPEESVTPKGSDITAPSVVDPHLVTEPVSKPETNSDIKDGSIGESVVHMATVPQAPPEPPVSSVDATVSESHPEQKVQELPNIQPDIPEGTQNSESAKNPAESAICETPDKPQYPEKPKSSTAKNVSDKHRSSKHTVLTGEGFKRRSKTYKSLRGRRRHSSSYSNDSSSSESYSSSSSSSRSSSSYSRSRTGSETERARSKDASPGKKQHSVATTDPARPKKYKRIKKVKEKVVKEPKDSESSMEEGEIKGDTDESSYDEVTDEEYEMSYSILRELFDRIDFSVIKEKCRSTVLNIHEMASNKRAMILPATAPPWVNVNRDDIASLRLSVEELLYNLVDSIYTMEEITMSVERKEEGTDNRLGGQADNAYSEREPSSLPDQTRVQTESESELDSTDEDVDVGYRSDEKSDSSFFEEVEQHDTSIYVDAVIGTELNTTVGVQSDSAAGEQGSLLRGSVNLIERHSTIPGSSTLHESEFLENENCGSGTQCFTDGPQKGECHLSNILERNVSDLVTSRETDNASQLQAGSITTQSCTKPLHDVPHAENQITNVSNQSIKEEVNPIPLTTDETRNVPGTDCFRDIISAADVSNTSSGFGGNQSGSPKDIQTELHELTSSTLRTTGSPPNTEMEKNDVVDDVIQLDDQEDFNCERISDGENTDI